MRRELLHLVVQTPRATVVETDVVSLRVPTESGQVGVRPRGEPAVTAIEPGLAIARTEAGTSLFVGTAGGLLRADGRRAMLLTPLAFAGNEPEAVMAAIRSALEAGDPELDLRRAIERLEVGMLRELGAPATGDAVRWNGGDRVRSN
jgi:F0F1-type ATP synthase epsilon subunit